MDIRHINENMGNGDRLIRAVVAVVIVAAYFNFVIGGMAGIILLILTPMLLMNAIFGQCFIYSLLGIRTKMKEYGH